MPGATLISRNQIRPAASTTRSVRDRSRSPSAACAATAVCGAARGHGSGSSRAGAKNSVVPAVYRRRSRRSRRPGRSRRPAGRPDRPRSRRPTRRPRSPARTTSTSAVPPYAKQPTIAAGRSSAVRTTAAPSDEPPLVGLTISGSPSRSTSAAITEVAPSSRNVDCGSATDGGVADPRRRHHRLGRRLVERRPARPRAGARRTAARAARGRRAASRPRRSRRAAAARRRPAVGARVPAAGRRRRPARRRRAAAAQGVGDPASRAHRHVALVREPAGEHDHGRSGRVHAVSGPGTSDVDSSCREPGTARPNVCTRSSSSSTTPASRRTPSRMRSGSG